MRIIVLALIIVFPLVSCMPAKDVQKWEYEAITGGKELPLEMSDLMCNKIATEAKIQGSKAANKRAIYVSTYKSCMVKHGWNAYKSSDPYLK